MSLVETAPLRLDSAVRRLGEGGVVTLARAPEGFDAFVVADLARSLARGRRKAGRGAGLCRARRGARAKLHRRARLRGARDRSALPAVLGLPALRPRLAQRRHFRRADDGAGASRQEPRLGRAPARPRGLGQRADAARAAARLYGIRGAFRRAGQHGADGRHRPLARGQRLHPCEHGARRRRLCARAAAFSISTRPALAAPIRLDFFGDTLESIRAFDPETQREHRAIALARPRADERGAAHDRVRSSAFVRATSPNSARPRRRRRSTRPSARADAPSASNTGCRCSTTSSTRSSTMSTARPSCSTRSAEEAASQRIAQSRTIYGARKRAATMQEPGRSDYKPLPPDAALSRRRTNGARNSTARRSRASRPSRRRPARCERHRLRRSGRAQFRARAAEEKRNVFEAVVAHIARCAREGPRRHRRGLVRRLARAPEPCARRAWAQIARARLLVLPGADRARGRAAARGDRARAGLRDADLADHRRAGHSGRPARSPRQAQAPRAGRAGGSRAR